MNHSRRGFLKTGLGAVAAAAAAAGCSGGEAQFLQAVPPPDPGVPRLRQNVKSLTLAEKTRLVSAILTLKRTPSPFDPSVSYYDQFVQFHQWVVRYGQITLGYGMGHQSPTFLTWHRKFLFLFEQAIRSLGHPDFALPYWDWTDEASLAVMFSDDLFGPVVGDPDDNYAVTSGPFAKAAFPVNLTPTMLGTFSELSNCPFQFLARGPKTVSLPTVSDVQTLLAITDYDQAPYNMMADDATSFRHHLEGMMPLQLHSAVHAYVGGTWTATYYDDAFNASTTTYVGSMTALDSSPNDPVFFLHHCNVDRLWAIWETLNGNVYVPESGSNQGWNAADELYPFTIFASNPLMTTTGLTNSSMLDVATLGYTFEELTVPG